MSLSDFMTSRIINSSDLELRKEEVEILDEELSPYNHATNYQMTGFNKKYLQAILDEKGSNDPRFMTFKQTNEMSMKVKKGSKSIPTVRFCQWDKNSNSEFNFKEANQKSKDMGLSLDDYKKNFVEKKVSIIGLFNGKDIEGISPYLKNDQEKSAELDSMIEKKLEQLNLKSDFKKGTEDYKIDGLSKILDATSSDLTENNKNALRNIFIASKLAEYGNSSSYYIAQGQGEIKIWASSSRDSDIKKVLYEFDQKNYMLEQNQSYQKSSQKSSNISKSTLNESNSSKENENLNINAGDKKENEFETIYSKMAKTMDDFYNENKLYKYVSKEEYSKLVAENIEKFKTEFEKNTNKMVDQQMEKLMGKEVSNFSSTFQKVNVSNEKEGIEKPEEIKGIKTNKEVNKENKKTKKIENDTFKSSLKTTANKNKTKIEKVQSSAKEPEKTKEQIKTKTKSKEMER